MLERSEASKNREPVIPTEHSDEGSQEILILRFLTYVIRVAHRKPLLIISLRYGRNDKYTKTASGPTSCSTFKAPLPKRAPPLL